MIQATVGKIWDIIWAKVGKDWDTISDKVEWAAPRRARREGRGRRGAQAPRGGAEREQLREGGGAGLEDERGPRVVEDEARRRDCVGRLHRHGRVLLALQRPQPRRETCACASYFSFN